MNLIDIIVDGLIHRLDPVLHEYLPVEQLCAMDTGQLLDFLDQGQRLLMGNKFRGLDAIHEELEFRQFKVPTCYIVAVIVPLRHLNDVQAKISQSFNITIDRLALRSNIMRLQVGNDLAGGYGMVFVRVFQQVLHDVDNLQLLK